jgi:tripeptide aminopeptidase
MEEVLKKFLRYVEVDTPSDEANEGQTPSTKCQFDLANMLAEELRAMGLEAEVTEHAYVYSSIPSNSPKSKYSIGFISHLDVVNETKGYGVKPQIHKNYNGGDICQANGHIISSKDFPVLNNYIGQDIVTSSGDTILGADDKAGIAEIMAFAEYVVTHPNFKHGKIGIAFTPDEEIGHGAKLFDIKKFGCDYAYTVDGEELGELCYETFNGAAFECDITGVNIHPGQAKGKMVNAIILANQIIDALPEDERPETTEGRQGYYFVNNISGGVEKCKLNGIIRDHDKGIFEERKSKVKGIVSELNKKYNGAIKLTMHDQYYNCAEVIEPHIHLIERAKQAMLSLGIMPITSPIRGGTDGSSLSFMGLPCPNICTGGHNAHGVSEFIPVGSMTKVVEILKNIAIAYA